jgi:hypothetical protein
MPVMKNNNAKIYQQLAELGLRTKENFYSKGIVLPSISKNGNVKIGKYEIIDHKTGFYSIADQNNDLLVEDLNLIQTAIVLANDMSLGHILDKELIETDKNYGYAAFEESVQRRLYTRADPERKFVLLLKLQKSRRKKEQFLGSITTRFDKLRRFA